MELQEQYKRLVRDFRIGNTDLVELPAPGLNNKIFAKLEYQNVSGSHYDRVYTVLLNDLELRREIKPGITTLVETTSGNAGVSCAFMAQQLGYSCIIYLPASLPENRKKLAAQYGAEVRAVEGTEYVAGASEAMGVFVKSQHERVDGFRVFKSPNHSIEPISCTAVEPVVTEALQAVPEGFTCFIGAAGNGTTLKGMGPILRNHNPRVKLFAFDCDSALVAYDIKYPGRVKGHKPKQHLMFGVGAWGVDFPHLNYAIKELFDDVLVVDWPSVLLVTEVLDKLGYQVGGSSAAAYHLAAQFCASRVNEQVLIVFYEQRTNRY